MSSKELQRQMAKSMEDFKKGAPAMTWADLQEQARASRAGRGV